MQNRLKASLHCLLTHIRAVVIVGADVVEDELKRGEKNYI